MDASALVVIAVSGAVGGAALYLGAGWLKQVARSARRERFVTFNAHPTPTPPATTPRPAPAAPADPAPPRVVPMASVLPPLPETTSPMPPGDTGWPSTDFPATQPLALSGLQTHFAETEPAPLEPR